MKEQLMKQGQAQITKAINDSLKAGGSEESSKENFDKIIYDPKHLVQNAVKEAFMHHMAIKKNLEATTKPA